MDLPLETVGETRSETHDRAESTSFAHLNGLITIIRSVGPFVLIDDIFGKRSNAFRLAIPVKSILAPRVESGVFVWKEATTEWAYLVSWSSINDFNFLWIQRPASRHESFTSRSDYSVPVLGKRRKTIREFHIQQRLDTDPFSSTLLLAAMFTFTVVDEKFQRVQDTLV